MKLRYYLRGIGLGIIVAAAICMCASLRNKGTEMTDAEIKARAEELGMIDSRTTLINASGSEDVSVIASPDEGEYATVSPEDIAIPVAEEVTLEPTDDESAPDAAETTEGADAAEPAEGSDEATEKEAAAKDEANASTDADNAKQESSADEVKEEKSEVKGEIVAIVVDKGNGSDTVARRLADAGLVANASEYDKYLMENGYDRRIAVGTHKIPKGSSNEEIAKLLTSKQD